MRAGGVGCVERIRNPIRASRLVLDKSPHVYFVGEGAERFAVAMGFPRENLLTENSRKIWMLWKQFNSDRDWWGPGIADPHWEPPAPDKKPQGELWRDRIQQLTGDRFRCLSN